MIECQNCNYWKTGVESLPEKVGYCCMKMPVTHVLNGQIMTAFPITTAVTGCAEGIQ